MTWKYQGLQGITCGYKGLEWVRGGYKGLQGVTGRDKGLQEHSQILFLGLFCIKIKSEEFSNF